MRFVCFSGWDQLPESANGLFAQGEKASLFVSRPWFESVTADGSENATRMLLACVIAGTKVLAILPLMKRPGQTWYSLRHRYTSLFSFLLDEHDRDQVLACLVEGLQQLPFQSLLLEPVATDDRHVNALQTCLESDGFSCHRSFRLYNWTHRLQGVSYRQYLAARPARLRNTIARKARKLAREQGFVTRVLIGDQVPPAMAEYHAVYRRSWKAHEQYPNLLEGMVKRFSSRGWSRLGLLSVRGQPVAAQLWVVLHGKASIFRLAYDEVWKHYSPGSILTGVLMEHVIDSDAVQEIDFLTGNEAYKQDWMSERRERWALSCVKEARPRGGFSQLTTSLRRMLGSPPPR